MRGRPSIEDSIINIGGLTVDLSNDPVMKSLLEVQKEDCKLWL